LLSNSCGNINATNSENLDEWFKNLRAKLPRRPNGGLPIEINFFESEGNHFKKSCFIIPSDFGSMSTPIFLSSGKLL